MPYLGNTAADRFVAAKAATQFSGDGSTTAFTLDHAVTQDEDVLVSVDGVIQEPSVAYAVSNGTTLTFTAAPSSNSGNNIFVYYLASQVGTVGHPSNQALSASTGTFSDAVTINDGDAGSVTANTVADELVVEASGAGGVSILTPDASDANLFLGGPGANAGAIVRWNDDSNLMSIGTNNSGGTMALKIGGFTDALTIDANGHISKPLQSAFLAYASSTQSNIAVGSDVTVIFGTEVFDQNADFNNSNYTFTAPVTGRYQLQTSVRIQDAMTASLYYYLQLVTSNRAYLGYIINTAGFDQDLNYLTLNITVLADMDASDTAFVRIVQHSGNQQTDIYGGNEYSTNFSGYLVA